MHLLIQNLFWTSSVNPYWRGWGLNFGKRRRIPLQPSLPKGKSTNYYDQTRKGLGYVTPSTQSESETKESRPSHFSDSSSWESDVSVGVIFKNLFVTTWRQWVWWSKMKTLNHLTPIHELKSWTSNGRSVSSNANLPPKTRWSRSMWATKLIQSLFS